jgi:hypothetical protein
MLKTIIEGEVADMFDEIVKVTDDKVLSWEYRLWPERTKKEVVKRLATRLLNKVEAEVYGANN